MRQAWASVLGFLLALGASQGAIGPDFAGVRTNPACELIFDGLEPQWLGKAGDTRVCSTDDGGVCKEGQYCVAFEGEDDFKFCDTLMADCAKALGVTPLAAEDYDVDYGDLGEGEYPDYGPDGEVPVDGEYPDYEGIDGGIDGGDYPDYGPDDPDYPDYSGVTEATTKPTTPTTKATITTKTTTTTPKPTTRGIIVPGITTKTTTTTTTPRPIQPIRTTPRTTPRTVATTARTIFNFFSTTTTARPIRPITLATTPWSWTTRATTPRAGGSQTTQAWVQTSGLTVAVFPSPINCRDHNGRCAEWAGRGECGINPFFMKSQCQTSCGCCGGRCQATLTLPCRNWAGDNCVFWQTLGECAANPTWMGRFCSGSCNTCLSSANGPPPPAMPLLRSSALGKRSSPSRALARRLNVSLRTVTDAMASLDPSTQLSPSAMRRVRVFHLRAARLARRRQARRRKALRRSRARTIAKLKARRRRAARLRAMRKRMMRVRRKRRQLRRIVARRLRARAAKRKVAKRMTVRRRRFRQRRT